MFTAPYFINPAELNWGPKYGYIWFGSCFLTAIWLFFCFPETKDRTLEEIDEMVSFLITQTYQGESNLLSTNCSSKRVFHRGSSSVTCA